MEHLKKRWRLVPRAIRRPVIFVVGVLFIIAAGLTGWLPGPGGIPLFLIGIAILSTEFEWAKKIRDIVIDAVQQAGRLYKAHKIVGTLLILIGMTIAIGTSVIMYRHFR